MSKWTPLWDANQDRRDVVKSARCTVRQPEDYLPLNACEFAGELLEFTCDARSCIDGTFCPKTCFGDPSVYVSCPTRLEKLRNKKDPP